MQFKSFEPDVEVNGQTVFSIVDGLGIFKSLSKKYLLEAGIGNEGNNESIIDLNAWYSQEKWLKAFQNIARDIGDSILFKIGYAIPQNAKFPSFVKDIDTAIKSIDIAYHLNHRKNGVELFDMTTGKMTEGIGHYGYERIKKKI